MLRLLKIKFRNQDGITGFRMVFQVPPYIFHSHEGVENIQEGTAQCPSTSGSLAEM